jgi:5-methyltetrahydrofolate--homocysteine methyltransferase
MVDLKQISEFLINGNRDQVRALVEKALSEGVAPESLVYDALVPGMNVVGAKFKNNEFYVPEVLIAARAMQAGMDILEPLVAEKGIKPVATVAIGTVEGDLHDIGKNLVAMMLKGSGFKILDLGVDVKADQFVQGVKGGANVLALSALLTTTMPSMKKTIQALQEANLRDSVKVIIGGAPVTESYAREIGADAYAPDAASAVDKVRELVGAPG